MRMFTIRRVTDGIMTETCDHKLQDVKHNDVFRHNEEDQWFIAIGKPYRNKDGILVIQCDEVK